MEKARDGIIERMAAVLDEKDLDDFDRMAAVLDEKDLDDFDRIAKKIRTAFESSAEPAVKT